MDPTTLEPIDPKAANGKLERRRVDSLDDTVRRVIALLHALAPTNPPPAAKTTGTKRPRTSWLPSRVHLFGFSDGGTVALEAAARCVGQRRLGGAAVVCARLLPEVLDGPPASDGWAANDTNDAAARPALARLPPDARAPTPVILTAGSSDEVVPRGDVLATSAVLRARHPGAVADVHVVPGKRHSMLSSEGETRALMAFWAHTLARRPAEAMGEGVYEVTPGVDEIEVAGSNPAESAVGRVDHRDGEKAGGESRGYDPYELD